MLNYDLKEINDLTCSDIALIDYLMGFVGDKDKERYKLLYDYNKDVVDYENGLITDNDIQDIYYFDLDIGTHHDLQDKYIALKIDLLDHLELTYNSNGDIERKGVKNGK